MCLAIEASLTASHDQQTKRARRCHVIRVKKGANMQVHRVIVWQDRFRLQYHKYKKKSKKLSFGQHAKESR